MPDNQNFTDTIQINDPVIVCHTNKSGNSHETSGIVTKKYPDGFVRVHFYILEYPGNSSSKMTALFDPEGHSTDGSLYLKNIAS